MALAMTDVQNLQDFTFNTHHITTILSTQEIYAMRLAPLNTLTQHQEYKEILIFQYSV
jgi:hypothetical protein